MLRILISAILLAVTTGATAADLSKIDRAIRNEPKYAGKPEYCLVVFGPDAAERVWLVRDGDTLYVDKNGNGDLTEAGKKFTGEKDGWSTTFQAGTIRIGKSEHRNFVVRVQQLSKFGPEVTELPVAAAALKRNPEAQFMAITAEIQVPGHKGSGEDGRIPFMARIDADGPLLFAATPKDAPIVHFGGPLAIRPEAAKPTLFRGVPHDLMLTVGTYGLGPGTFALVAYDKLIPESAHIVVDARTPGAKTGDPAIRTRFELRERC
jgi:hypothetical protein